MTRDDDIDLEQISSDWLSEKPPEFRDLPALMRRKVFVYRLGYIRDVMVSIIGILVGILLIASSRNMVGIAVLIFSFLGLGLTIYARRNFWRVPFGTVDDEYLTLYDHAQMQMRIGWSGVALNLASVGFLTAILAINPLQKLAPSIVGLVVVAVGYIALMTIISVWTLVNSVRQVERLQAYHVVHSTRDFDGQAD